MVGVGVAAALAVAAATGPPWWFKLVGLEGTGSAPPSTTEVGGMSGGCAPFQVFAQGRWRPLGTAIRAAPNVLSAPDGQFPGEYVDQRRRVGLRPARVPH
jgi:hypothetical protein